MYPEKCIPDKLIAPFLLGLLSVVIVIFCRNYLIAIGRFCDTVRPIRDFCCVTISAERNELKTSNFIPPYELQLSIIFISVDAI